MKIQTSEEIKDRINYYLDKKSITKYKLAKRCNLSNSSITNIFVYDGYPSLPLFLKIVQDGLSIPLSEFFGETEEKPDIDITEEEERLLYKYRSLSKRNKELLKKFISIM